ncbi:hypothetical protein B0H19DRAFT_57882 [Mycena capillaripes]|nr:hypothetical protein B0H19DRAFT_57882 [Mycena capillaripes]
MDTSSATLLSKQEVRAQIELTETNIRHLTSNIRGLQFAAVEYQIIEFTRERQKERDKLAWLWFMISPVGTLPTELLLEIFALAVQSHPTNLFVCRHSPPFGRDHPIHRTLVLSQICSSWRQIVVASPRLWATGVVDVRLDGKNTPHGYLSFVQMLLDRSAPLLISISLATVSHISPFPAIVQIIVPTVSRWRNLRVDEASLEVLKENSSGPYTALQRLEIQYDSFISRRNNVFRMPWPQLTHLDLLEPVAATCRSILLQCTNIVSAKLTPGEWDVADAPSPVTVFPFLRTLEIRFHRRRNPIRRAGEFFAPLRLPALQALTLDAHIVWPLEEFSAFQLRAPNITQFTLKDCPINAQQLVALLQLAPRLTVLTLISCRDCIDNEFLRAFTYDETRGQLLVPSLQTIHWQHLGHRFDDDILETAIRSRWAKDAAPADVPRLRKITTNKSSLDPTFADKMQDLVKQGLKLHLIEPGVLFWPADELE